MLGQGDPMEVTCLSVPSPRSYLLCYGVADVENRGFATDYRGTLYIHSTGRYAFAGMPDMSAYPTPVIREFDRLIAAVADLEEECRYLSIPEQGVRVTLKNEYEQTDATVAEYALLSDVYTAYRKDPHQPFFHVKSIVGTVDLVDIVTDARSPWAEKGYNHWILENPVLFSEPFTGISISRTGLWKHELPL